MTSNLLTLLVSFTKYNYLVVPKLLMKWGMAEQLVSSLCLRLWRPIKSLKWAKDIEPSLIQKYK